MIENICDNILVEKYRAKKFSDVILETHLKNEFQAIIDKAKSSNPVGLPHIIMEGTPGVGKTTVAKVLCLELGLEHLFLNAGTDLKSSDLEYDVKKFAETMSVYEFDENGKEIHKKKVVIVDEADGLSKQSNVAKSLKAFIEMYSSNCTFIFTCNNFNSITNDQDVKEALKSRCGGITNFNIKDKNEFQKQIAKRLAFICDKEQYKFSKKNIVDIVKHYNTDIRSMINFIDRHYFELEKENLVYSLTRGKIDELFNNIRNRDFVSIRSFITNTDINHSQLFYEIYSYVKDYVEPGIEVPKAILITERFMDNFTRSINPEITLVAYLITLASEIKWKKS